MNQDNHEIILEAREYAKGLSNLIGNIDSAASYPVEYVEPFQWVVMIQPIIERLDRVLKDMEKPATFCLHRATTNK